MSRLKKRKLLVVFVGVFFCLILSVAVRVNASSSMRFYMRHDCSDADSTSYDLYALYTLPGLSNYSSPRTIIGNNDFKRDANQSIVSIGYNGSGTIVGDHVIATCAHCVINKATGEFYSPNIYIIGNGNTPITTISPRYIHVCRSYLNGGENYDYKLDLGMIRDGYQGTVYVSGFPTTYPSGAPSGYGYRFKSAGTIDWSATHNDANGLTLWHTADSDGGVSGGPLFIRENISTGAIDSTYANVDDTDNIINQDDNYNISIIGIHFCGGNGNNGSIKITEDLLHFYLNNNFVY